MKMRPGGKEIDTITTHAPGHLEFLPNHPGPRRRQMDGDRLYITYGQRNMVQSFRSVDVSTRTEPATPTARPLRPGAKIYLADFDPKTGQLAHMKQWDDFRYVEGDRKAIAKQASLDQDTNRMTLEKPARASGTLRRHLRPTSSTWIKRAGISPPTATLDPAVSRTRKSRTPICYPATNPSRPPPSAWSPPITTRISSMKARPICGRGQSYPRGPDRDRSRSPTPGG